MKVKIASSQYPIGYFSSIEEWCAHSNWWINEACDAGAQLLLFPEYGSMELASLLEQEIQGDLHAQIESMQSFLEIFKSTYRDIAIKRNVIIVAPSFPVKQGSQFVNRVFVFGPSGEVGYQDKLFMTRFETEQWGISSGAKELTVFEAEWGRFGIQICYDSEFSIGAHALAIEGMDVLLVPSCTETLKGATRVHVGTRARAMENQIYGVVSQTVKDALWSPAVDVNYGYTAFYSTPDKGFSDDGIISVKGAQIEGWHYEMLDISLLKTVQEDGQVFNKKDHQLIEQLWNGNSFKVKVVKV